MNNTVANASWNNKGRGDSHTLIHPELFSDVSRLVQAAVEEGVFPGCVLIIGQNGRVLWQQAAGQRYLKVERGDSPSAMAPGTVFDAASVSSVLATTTLMMQLVDANKVRLEDRLCWYLNSFGVHHKSAVTVEQLLNHTAGLVSWQPFFEELLHANTSMRMGILTSRGARDYVINSINRSQLKYEPGTRQVYSDNGLILLGHLIETLTGSSLDRAAYKHVFQPLGLRSSSFIDLSLIKRRGIHPVKDMIAPTEDCPWRKRVLCGEVHDDNAWAMGGISGHSGIFCTAGDLHVFASEMLRAYHGESTFFSQEVVRRFWGQETSFGETRWRLGWDSPSKDNGMDESSLSTEAVGVNGFTGCSLWIEPALDLDIVLMSNRVHPQRSNRKIRSFRPELHSAIIAALQKL